MRVRLLGLGQDPGYPGGRYLDAWVEHTAVSLAITKSQPAAESR